MDYGKEGVFCLTVLEICAKIEFMMGCVSISLKTTFVYPFLGREFWL